ncbi:hypothetical protein D9M68_682140 [compost metagenome]
MDLLPESGQAPGEQAAGLLRGMLAEQLDLSQRLGDFIERQGGLALEQFFGAFQAQSVERTLQAFRRFIEAGALPIGFAYHAQRQGGTILHQLGDIAQRAATVAQGAAHLLVVFARHRQQLSVQLLEPGVETAR